MTNRTRRVAVYGGSFNPPHVGHTMVMAYVLAVGQVDELWLVPCYRHAFGKDLVDYEHRFQMCQILVQPFTQVRVAVSRIEERLGGESRTIDTIHRLRKENPTYHFDLVVGSDIFAERFEWKSFDELEHMCRFIVIGRAGFEAPPGHPVSPEIVDVSSTQIRQRLINGQEVTGLVPDDIAAYIQEHGLYK